MSNNPRPPVRPPHKPSSSSTGRPPVPSSSTGPSPSLARPPLVRPGMMTAPGVRPGGMSSGSGFALGVSGGMSTGRPMMFRPTAPVRRVKVEEPSAPVPSTIRGGRPPRIRGSRGGNRGGGGRGGSSMGGGNDDSYGSGSASGPFALGPSNAARVRHTPIQPPSSSSNPTSTLFQPSSDPSLQTDEEFLSQNRHIIDLEMVPSQGGESAPTGMISERAVKEGLDRRRRERMDRLGDGDRGKGKGKAKEEVKMEEIKEALKQEGGVLPESTNTIGRVKQENPENVVPHRNTNNSNTNTNSKDDDPIRVKDEPISPQLVAQSDSILAGLENGTGAPQPRNNDDLMDEDMDRDVSPSGRRIMNLPPISLNGSEVGGSRDGTPANGGGNAVAGGSGQGQGGRVDVKMEDVIKAAERAVDLSDSESEDEEGDMYGDFVQEEGQDNPNDKIYLFQFPHPFPDFKPAAEYNLTHNMPEPEIPDIKPDIPAEPVTNGTALKPALKKKSVGFFGMDVDDEPMDGSSGAGDRPAAGQTEEERAAEKAKAEKEKVAFELKKQETEKRIRAEHKEKYAQMERERKPEGRIGTLVVMRSGKVKMVLGKDIVMDATPGVPTTFVQQLVHLSTPTKTASVLGEINKSFIMTPDIDRLLEELRVHGGEVPGEDVKPVIKKEKE